MNKKMKTNEEAWQDYCDTVGCWYETEPEVKKVFLDMRKIFTQFVSDIEKTADSERQREYFRRLAVLIEFEEYPGKQFIMDELKTKGVKL